MGTRINSPDEEGVLHYVTLNVRNRKTPFRRPEYAHIALDDLRFECSRSQGKLIAYVVMPDHLHFLMWLQDGMLSQFLKRFKPAVTKKLDAMAQINGRERERQWLCEKGRRELWQDGKHSLHLWSPHWIKQKIAYIHENPVRGGLVKSAADYPFSSYAAYYSGVGNAPVAVDLLDYL